MNPDQKYSRSPQNLLLITLNNETPLTILVCYDIVAKIRNDSFFNSLLLSFYAINYYFSTAFWWAHLDLYLHHRWNYLTQSNHHRSRKRPSRPWYSLTWGTWIEAFVYSRYAYTCWSHHRVWNTPRKNRCKYHNGRVNKNSKTRYPAQRLTNYHSWRYPYPSNLYSWSYR